MVIIRMAVSAIAKIFARQIRKGNITMADVPDRIKDQVREAYLLLFGEEVPEEIEETTTEE